MNTQSAAKPTNDNKTSNAVVCEPTSKPQRSSIEFELERILEMKPKLESAYLIKGLMPRSGLHVLYGPPGSKKSFIALDAALHVAAGREWAGCKVRQTGVVYIAAEGSQGVRRRAIAAAIARGFSPEIPFRMISGAPRFARDPNACDVDKLIRAIKNQTDDWESDPGLIVIDTLARTAYELDESSSKDMGAYVELAGRLSESLQNALIMPIHHSGKDLEKGMRGSSALNAAADAQWLLMSNEDGSAVLHIDKMKDGAPHGDLRFEFVTHEFGADEDGDQVDTLVVRNITSIVCDTNADPKVRIRLREQALMVFMSTLAANGSTGPSRGAELPETTKAVPLDEARKAFCVYLQKTHDEKSAEATANKQLRALVTDGILCKNKEWLWSPIISTDAPAS